MIPGTVATGVAGFAATTAAATEENVEYTFGSPMVTNATSPPASSRAATLAAAASSAPARSSGSGVMANTRRSTAMSGAAPRTMVSARPIASPDVQGATTTVARRSACTARTVTRSAAPGPTPTPTRRPGTGGSGGSQGPAPSVTRRSTAWRISSASDRRVRAATASSRRFSGSGR